MIHLDYPIHAFIPIAMASKNTFLNAKNTKSALAEELQEDPLHDSIIPLKSSSQSSLEFSSIEVPTNLNSIVVDEMFIYYLPCRSNHDVPPMIYELDLIGKINYPISNHMSY